MSKQPPTTGAVSAQGKQTLMTTSNQNSLPPQDQFKSISGGATAELNYANVEYIANGNAVNGPCLKYDKNQLCMMTPVGITTQDQVKISNVGVTTITYDWRRVQRGDFITSKNSDQIQRFYCHYPHGLLKPMESKTFTFSFRSSDKPGMFFEEWELITDPQTITKLPLFYLSGMATLNDDKRQGDIQTQMNAVQKAIKENAEKQRELDELDQVREPEPPKPDIRDIATFNKDFEERNRHIGVYFSKSVMDQLFELIDDIIYRAPALQEDIQAIYDNWHASLEYVESLLSSVVNPYTRNSLNERYMKILSQSRKVPTDRAQSYGVFRTMLLNLCEQTIDLEQKARDELQTIANPGFIVPHDAITPEEIKKIEDERKAKKADWYKATKKKPKTDDEEAQEIEEIKQKTIAGLKNDMLANRLTKVGREIDILRTKWLMENHEKMDRSKYDDLYHLESVLDIDVAGKDIIVRLDLDVPLSAYTPPPADSHQGTHDDLARSQGTKETKGGKTTKSGKGKEEPVSHQPKADEPWKRREILNHALLKRAANELRYLQQERMANRIFVLGNLQDRSGRVKPENSMKIIHNALQKTIHDQPLIFIDDAVIQDFEQKKENELFPEQSTFILENLNFKPDEFGYVEPEKIVEDPAAVKAREEELARIEEEKQKEILAAQQKGGAKAAPAKPAPAAPVDKKKEEEMKKKAEEEAAALAKKKAEEAALSNLTEEEKAEIQRAKEEAERKKREAEYFDYRTIHKFKNTLGKYGELFVNDAPLATLTQSNSIVEIKCKRKVMGVKMTEELRKLCMFFLKKHPKDIADLWYNKPAQKTYFNKEFSAVIGGNVTGVQDILDRILLANALLDQTHEIYFAGQFGLAALAALGVKVGLQENAADVEQTQEFFRTLFLKAVQKNARIIFPQDVLVATQAEIDQAKQEQGEYEQHQQQLILQQQQEAQRLQNQLNTGGSKQGKTGGKGAEQQKTGGALANTGGSGLGGVDHPLNQSINGNEMGKGPKSWSDRLLLSGKGREVKLTDKIAHNWNEIVKGLYNKYVEEGKINKDSEQGFQEHPLTRNAFMVNLNREVMSRQNTTHDEQSVLSGGHAPSQHTVVESEVKNDDIVIEYMGETREQLITMISQTFKLLWDGSLSPSHDSVGISPTNKQFVEALLELRVTTQNDDEPPVTLLHGPETDSVVKQALLKIKVEQQEALEEQKRKAKELKLAARLARQAAGEDDDEEDEEEEEEEKNETMTNNGDESIDHGHGHGEMGQIADFHVHEIHQFTTKVMQGVANKALLAMNSHRRKGQQEISEELYLLEEI